MALWADFEECRGYKNIAHLTYMEAIKQLAKPRAVAAKPSGRKQATAPAPADGGHARSRTRPKSSTSRKRATAPAPAEGRRARGPYSPTSSADGVSRY